jgi:signal transduction histidine kinase
MEIQYEVDDIIQDKHNKTYEALSRLVDQFTDKLEAIIVDEIGEGPILERIRKRVEGLFQYEEMVPKEVFLDQYVKDRLENLTPWFLHREIGIIKELEPAPSISMPEEIVQKVIDGLVKNAIENTPDEGEIEIIIQRKGEGVEMQVRDYGVGIIEEHKRRIFEGFFPTRETMDYSTKRPFDFNAGGKGADLLRMKFFSERYGFQIEMNSSKCWFIPKENDVCPGRISECSFCRDKDDCHLSGGTFFSVYFPIALKKPE